jgi:serine O-acetyltransferase
MPPVIESRSDYRRYLAADLEARGLARWRRLDGMRLPELLFQRRLRRVEYLEACRRDPLGRLWCALEVYRLKRLSVRLGFTIPRRVFGPGLAIVHYGTIVVSDSARVGSFCRLHADVNIGLAAGAAPRIGDRVYIGPGAKLFGGITIGDDVAIGANAVVNSDVPPNVSVAGVPAKVVSERGSQSLLGRAPRDDGLPQPGHREGGAEHEAREGAEAALRGVADEEEPR